MIRHPYNASGAPPTLRGGALSHRTGAVEGGKFCPLSHRIHSNSTIIGGVINVFDVAPGERVEAELERFIEKRARDRTKENAFEKAWAASERRHLEKRRKENAAAWCSFHLGQAERLEQTAAALAASHRQRAAELGGGAMP